MLKRLIRRMLTAQIISALTVSVCLLIDNIMIGRFLKESALAAYGLANPVLLVLGAVSSMLCAGAQVACGKSLGRGDREETDVGYSSAVAVSAVFAAVFMLLIIPFRGQIAWMLGAKTPSRLTNTGDYILGFSIGTPALMASMILVPFLQMAGQSNRLIAAVLGMTVADVCFDILSVRLNGGMFGMGLASSLSYYVAMIIGGSYFLSKKCVFSFSFRRVRWKKIRELIFGGLPTVFGMASSVVMVFGINRILLAAGGGEGTVAAFSIINTVMNAANCISTGASGVALTLSGVLFHEEDRSGLAELMRSLARSAVILGAVTMVLLIVFADPCVGVFVAEGQTRVIAARGLPILAAGLIFCCLNNAMRGMYQGTGRVQRMEALAVLDNAALPVAAAFILSRIAGVNAVWYYFVISEGLTTLIILVSAWLENRRVSWRDGKVLLLRKSFGVPAEDLLESQPGTMEAVLAFAQEAEAFCLAHNGSRRMASHLALCIEEMGGNIVKYGFRDQGGNHLSIRLQYKGGRWTQRFRDDCVAFDPLQHMTGEDTEEGVGIRLAMKMADEARYTYSLNLNNLTLVLRELA